MNKVAVIGSRTFDNYKLLKETLDSLKIDLIVSGGAKGADSLAEQYAKENGIETIIHQAEWEKFGRKAGPIRNEYIIRDSDIVVAFWNGKSTGTYHSINLAKKAGKELLIINF